MPKYAEQLILRIMWEIKIHFSSYLNAYIRTFAIIILMHIRTIGLIKEGKIPSDTRVCFTPEQCKHIEANFGYKIIVQKSETRAYKDEEYSNCGIELADDVSHCDVLIGIKEVPVANLIPNKIYFFFSHTIKKQAHNRKLLQAILDKHITLLDYEVLVDERGERLIAFGRFAGIVGAHNTIRAYGLRHSLFDIKPMYQCFDMEEALQEYHKIKLGTARIVLTGNGRVSSGAKYILQQMNIREVSVHEYLNNTFSEAVFTQLEAKDYVQRIADSGFDKQEFYSNPALYKTNFLRFIDKTDVFINGIFYNNKAPRFFELDDMKKPDFTINTIGDITCDMMPYSSVPATVHTSTIAEPFWGFSAEENNILPNAFSANGVTMMTIDNLPNELPRDASSAFGDMFLEHILPEFAHFETSAILRKATIAKQGSLQSLFHYLDDYVHATT